MSVRWLGCGLCVVTILAGSCVPAATDLDGAANAGAGAIGVSKQALTSPPDGGCVPGSYSGKDYWFCPAVYTWQTARTKCQSIGYDLASVSGSGENQFLLANLLGNAWIGGRDSAVEGTWRWVEQDKAFWQGAANGSAVGGAYTNWVTGQPDNSLNQDCAIFRGTLGGSPGKWSDESCSNLAAFVCEGDLCPTDPNKTEPGQCGCGTPDTDSDGDGTANCKDGCPADATKTAPGVCGCGVAETDSDADGTPNCKDECPSDFSKTVAGDCGCPSAPKPSGTACNDGLCAENNQCNGAGACGTLAQCGTPDSLCTSGTRGGISYWFCNNDRSYADARRRCQAIGMDLAAVESAGEDTYIGAHIIEHSFLGGTDQVVEGTWRWQSTGKKFFVGGPTGSPFEGAYTNWEPGQPSQALSTYDCLAKDPILPAKWEVHSCSTLDAYVCESVGPISDLETCVEQIPPRTDLTGVALERWYQAEILRRCAARGDSACVQDLRGRVNLDYTSAALALASQSKTPAQYLALIRDRARKARAFETVAGRADALCAGDTDGDFVPNGTDLCPSTPPLTPTNDSGCTDNTLPPAPSAEDVKNILDKMGFAFNAACSGTKILQQPSLGGFYWPSDTNRGVFVFSSRANDQVQNCPVWYVFDIEEIVLSGSPRGFDILQRYQVTFKETEEATALMGTSSQVPSFAVQFQALPTDAGSRGRLGGTGLLIKLGGINGVRFRVKVLNGGGIQSAWSPWKITQTPGDCEVLGFDCN